MDQLKHDWLTEGLIDYEYKKYVLLAYLKNVRAKFDGAALYPFLSDLVFHYRNLERIRASKQLLFEHFPKRISKADFHKLEITYHLLMNDDSVMREIEDIIAFAIPQLTQSIDKGKELYEFVEENVEFIPVGLSSIYEKEGYLFIGQEKARNVNVYRYQVTVFESSNENYRGVSTSFVQTEMRSISTTYEKIKIDLVKKFKDLPNPATYLLISKLELPEESTLLPVAKRLLIKNISVD